MQRLLLVLLMISFLISCQEEPRKTPPPPPMPGAASNVLSGEVLETMDASSYTYAKVENNGSEIWIAGPKTPVSVGEIVYYIQGMEMKNFKSEALGQTFEAIFFVDKLSTKDIMMQSSGNPHGTTADVEERKSAPKSDAVVKHTGEVKSVANIYENMKALSGQTVTVQGKVVKFNGGILDRNWIHIQDGTDFNGDYDLLVTSQEEVRIGSIATFTGKVAVDVDFGAGYSYKVLVEEGKLVGVEQ